MSVGNVSVGAISTLYGRYPTPALYGLTIVYILAFTSYAFIPTLLCPRILHRALKYCRDLGFHTSVNVEPRSAKSLGKILGNILGLLGLRGSMLARRVVENRFPIRVWRVFVLGRSFCDYEVR